MLADFWQRKVRKEDYDDLARMLGVRWTKEDVEAMRGDSEGGGVKRKAPSVVVIPLSAQIEPSIVDQVKGMFGRKMGIDAPSWAKQLKDEEVVELYDESRENFLRFMGGLVRPRLNNTP